MTDRRKVLIVDDEPFIRRSLSFVLKKERYEVLEARNGEEAVAMILSERPDLVFLDVMMPKLTGFEVAERIRQHDEFAAMKIILLTAKGQDADRERGETVGADDYITKPFSPSKIVERTRRLFADGGDA